MSLPAIAPYALPTEAELPPGRLRWEVDPARAVLLVHDMQDHFLRAFDHAQEPVPQLLAHVASLRDACAAAGVPVVLSAQPGGQTREQRGRLQELWGDGVAPGDDALHPELAPRPGDLVLTKWRYSAFVRTDLAERLAELGRDQLIVTGIYGHIGCLMTACDAFMRDLHPFFVADAVADFSREDHEMAIDWAARRCAVVTTTARLLAGLGGADATTNLREDVLAVLPDAPAVLAADDHLVDLGLDSMAVMALVSRWRERGIAVSFEDLAEVEPTLDAWGAVLRERAAA